MPGAENAGKPGYYTVKPGDTLIRIGLENGQNWRDIKLWNNIENPNLIEVGQVLRVVPPGVDPGAAAVTPRPVPSAGRVDTPSAGARPAGTRPLRLGASDRDGVCNCCHAGRRGGSDACRPPAPVPRRATVATTIVWIWPAAGAVVAGFDEGRNKGLTITGKAGDPVVAAGDGRVVYAGSSLRGYGNLVIVKHSDLFLTAYAHNQVLLVKDDQVVRRGQKIAEMGSSDAERVQLHFEIRRQGKPVDPAKLLPPR